MVRERGRNALPPVPFGQISFHSGTVVVDMGPIQCPKIKLNWSS